MAKKTTSLATWDQQLADAAKIAVEAEKGTGGSFFSVKGGVLQFDGAPVPGNKMCVVILDSILENVYFSEAYDPETVSSPKCYAFSRDEATIQPHPQVFERGDAQCGVGNKCSSCPHNVFGSADVGRGKACRNTRRLALIPAGTYDKDKLTLFTKPDQLSTSIGFLKLPVTSVKDYSIFVKQLAGALKRPPFAIFTSIVVVPDAKTQFKITFQAVANVPDELIPTVLERHEEAKALIEFPYPAPDTTPPAAKKGKEAKVSGKKGRKY